MRLSRRSFATSRLPSAATSASTPLLELFQRQPRVTSFGNDVLVRLRESKTVKSRLPLLLVLGHNGSPICPPHHLGEVVEAVCSVIKRPHDSMPLEADPTYGGAIIDTGQMIEMCPELSVIVSRRTFNARIEIRKLPPHTSAAAVAAFAESRFATGTDGAGYVREGPDGLVTIYVDHVAFVTDLVRRLRSAGVTHRFERTGLTGTENGKVVTLTTSNEVARRFIEASIPRLEAEAVERVRALEHQLHLAEGLLVGSALHSVVDQICAAADDAADAVWGLTHFRSPELQSRPSFRYLKFDKAELDARRAELIARVPEMKSTAKGFSVDQAKALVKEKRLARQQESSYVNWRAKRAEIRQLEAHLTPEQLNLQLEQQLRSIAETHKDERRAKVVRAEPPPWRMEG